MSNPITDYNTLVSALVDIIEDDGTELRAYIPVAIANAEQRLARELSHEINAYTSTISIAASTATISKPNGHKLTDTVTYIDPDSRTHPLDLKDLSYLEEYWPQATSVGTPKYYANVDRETIRICPAPVSAANVRIKGERRPTALTSANTTNVYTSVCPDALYFAALMELAVWSRNNEILNNASQFYISTRDSLNAEGIRSRRDSGSSFRYEPNNTVINALKNGE